jgi:hypothetical protein
MIKIDASYTEYYDATDPNYPGGKGVDATTEDSFDGTPYKKELMNDIVGWRQAAWIKAFGSIAGISGVPDNIEHSDTLNAILKIIQDSLNAQYFIKNVTGVETVIPLSELNITFDTQKKYFIFISPGGNYPEFLPFGYEVMEDGLHIFPYRLIDNEKIPGTRMITWGVRLWGEGLWGEFGSMPVNIIIKEL